MKYIKYLILFLVALNSCKQPTSAPGAKPTYTIKGRVLNGTTNVPYANQQISAMVHTDVVTGPTAQLGTSTTDANGNFILTYTQTDINYDYASIQVMSNYFILNNIAVNKNIDSTFYLSTMGSIKVYLNLQTKINQNDTLFMGLPIFNSGGDLVSIEVDTILNAVSGYYKTFRLPPPSETFHTGIGSKDFNYDYVNRKFRSPGHLISFKITGDPYIDTVTIHY